MDCDNPKQEASVIPYDVLFVASSTPCLADDCQVRWKEAKISVAKYEKLTLISFCKGAANANVILMDI